MKILVKTSMRLLLRTKAFWFFLILMPILSTFILKIKFDSSSAYILDFPEEVIDLSDADQKVAYYGGKGEFVVKVYDAAGDELSEAFLSRLAKSGMFLIVRTDISKDNISDMDEYMKARIDKDGYQDRMGAVIYLDTDFAGKVLGGESEKALKLYLLSDDSRIEAFQSEAEFQLSKMESLIAYASTMNAGKVEAKDVVKAMDESDSFAPEKEVVSIAGGVGRDLSVTQTNQKSQVGYAFAFMTLGFVFCGIFVAHTSINEQKNGVFTRINLTKTSVLKYFASKFVSVVIISLMITAVVAVCSLTLNSDDIGMSRIVYLLMIFMMGLILSSLSMLVGILMGDVMSANVAAFTLWCMSALLSGLYFPLNYTSTFLKALSFMMPQKWFLEGTEMIFVGDNKAILMLICITAAYLVATISLGGLGLKIRRTEAWGNS